MLVNKDINPNKSLYYIGAKIIDIIKKENLKIIDVTFIKNKINENEYISMPLILLAFDWLFLLEILDMQGNHIVYTPIKEHNTRNKEAINVYI